MPDLRFTRSAARDLEEIRAYIARDKPLAAVRFLENLIKSCRTLATSPEIGRARPELSPGLRSFSVRKYLIFYWPTKNGVEIARVVHASRDLRSFSWAPHGVR